jgi:hypothetical protein
MVISRRASQVLLSWSLLGGAAPLVAQAPAAQTIKLEQAGVIPGPADLVRVSGSLAYITAGPALRIVDISQPADPVAKGTLTLPDAPTAMAVAGSSVYLAMGLRGLAIVDARNPDAPVLAGSYKTPGESIRVAVSGSRVMLADRMSGAEVIDVSDQAKPVPVGSHYTDGYTRDVALAGTLAYIVDSTNDFIVVDINRGKTPVPLSTQQSPLTSTLVTLPIATTAPKTAYVLGGPSLQVYDVSDPSAVRRVAQAKVPPAQALAVDGTLLYLAAGAEGLQVLDVSSPSAPLAAGSFKTPGAARDVAVAGGLVFVAVAAPRKPAEAGGASASPPGILILRKSH